MSGAIVRRSAGTVARTSAETRARRETADEVEVLVLAPCLRLFELDDDLEHVDVLLVLASVLVAQTPAIGADATGDGGLAFALLVQCPVEEALADKDGGGSGILGTRWAGAGLGGAGVAAVAR